MAGASGEGKLLYLEGKLSHLHWMQVCLGWGLWMSCAFTRNYRIYKRDVKNEEPVGLGLGRIVALY